jgi:glucose/arabinose dehydrogenase
MRLVPFAAALAPALALAAACSSGSPAARPSASSAAPSSAAPSAASASPSAAAPSAGAPSSAALTGPPRLALVGTFASPIYVTAPAGDARLFVVEQAGRIKVLRAGRAPETFLDIVSLVGSGGERGLLSMAFAPDYATSGLFYVDYTDTSGDSRIAEYRVSRSSPDRADPASRRELLKVAQPYPNHNGGLLMFDPGGRLVIGFGDGGSGGDPQDRGQNLGELLGKVLRIDPRPSGGRPYGIPPDNPFVSRSGARPEIWAYGLRNPWRFSFDPANGDLYLADVGQGAVEEVNVVPAARQSGANFGWSKFEGDTRYKSGALTAGGPVVTPVHTYGHDGGRCSVTGGVVYRGSVAALRGRYLFADYCSGEVWSFAAGTKVRPAVSALPFTGGHPVSFGVDGHGEAYLASAGGEVWRITADK